MLVRKENIAWRVVDTARARQLTDARLQLHHAAQLVAGFGVPYLETRADDGHTNMEWLHGLDALASNPAGPRPIRLALRPRDLTLLVVAADVDVGSFALHERTMADAAAWIRRTVSQYGMRADAYTLAKHYTIPAHPVGVGRSLDARATADFTELDHWFSNAATLLEDIARRTAGASSVRCWPHHFDIATLIELGDAKTIGVGLEPGDAYYNEPYWYVNSYPPPHAGAAKPALDAGGLWHTRDWTGAVLPASLLPSDETQANHSARFLDSAIAANRALLSA